MLLNEALAALLVDEVSSNEFLLGDESYFFDFCEELGFVDSFIWNGYVPSRSRGMASVELKTELSSSKEMLNAYSFFVTSILFELLLIIVIIIMIIKIYIHIMTTSFGS
jgi:hypothetical protein